MSKAVYVTIALGAFIGATFALNCGHSMKNVAPAVVKLAARDTSGAVESGKVDDVRKAYKAIEALLLKLGIVIPAGTVGARSDGWTPCESPRI